MTNDQPYRDALSVDEARHEISTKAGLEFDPDVVSAFLSLDFDSAAVSDS
jgi:HD-GYP domain-containing protein (c-di-GMP phosphodiesterase class II)